MAAKKRRGSSGKSGKRGRAKSPEARVSMKQGNVKVEAFCRLDQVSECVQTLKAALAPMATEKEGEQESG